MLLRRIKYYSLYCIENMNELIDIHGRVLSSTWENRENQKKYAKWLGEKLGYIKTEDWYKITGKIFIDNYGSALLRVQAGNSPIQLVKILFPENEWLEWKFNKTPNSFWKDRKNQLKYVKWLGEKLGYIHREDWYNITQNLIQEYHGSGLLQLFKNSPILLVRNIFSEFEWFEWKFVQTSKNFWTDKNNHIKYAKWLGEVLGFEKQEDWYKITHDSIVNNCGGGLMRCYKDSPVEFLKAVFPEEEWLEWKFGQTPKQFWRDKNNHKIYADWLALTLGYKKTEDWYNVTRDIIADNYGGGLINIYYNSSPTQFVKILFPEYEWVEWKFTSASHGYWEETEHHKKYAEWLGIVLGYKDKNDWYSVTRLHIINNCGGTLLGNYYNNSPQQFLRAIFPECEWHEWKFIQTSKNYWADANNRINYANRLGEILGYTEPEHWYKISRSMIGDNHGHGVLNYCKSYTEIPKMLYPEYNWVETNFWNYKTETKLYESLLSIYPMIITQFKQDWCMKTTYLKFDFCIPEHNIIIELDGPQHFIQVSNWSSPEEQFVNDKFKEKCANENGFSVIRILQEDVLFNKYDWVTELYTAIEEIKNGDEIVNVYLCKNEEYSLF